MEAMEIPEMQPNGSAEAPSNKLFVRDLVDGNAIDSVFLVKDRSLQKKKNGEAYLRLVLGDSSGTVPAVCWERAEESHGLAELGAAVRIQGRYAVSDRYGAQVTVQALSAVA